MKKFIKTILPVFAFALLVFIPIINAQAKTITSLDATQSNGEIRVSGTAEAGTLAVAIMVYDSDETNLVAMQTTSVQSDNTYKDTITIESGTYVVKVADYDGGNYITKTVSPATDPTTPEEKIDPETANGNASNNDVEGTQLNATGNPKTGDNILSVVIIALLSLIVSIAIYIHINKKRKLHQI